jgi:predicted acylesterase/phospholipase RssA
MSSARILARWHQPVGFACTAALAFLLAACTTLSRNPVPLEVQDNPSIAGYEDIRFLPLTSSDAVRESIRQAYLTEMPGSYDTLPDGSRSYNYLAVSGGGSDGAFGAGILNGWSVKGDRPPFKVVTGVSTGALIAPLAFLGTSYDPQLKEAYTTINPDRIYIVRRFISILWEEAVADNKPLKDLVAHYITEDVLDEIAKEHAKGRRLYVASTNMDREEPVVWDMGQIASSHEPGRLELFRSVMVASAAIPSVFPPVLVKVSANGETYDEMHSDGGVFFQSFFIGSVVDLPALIREADPDFTGQVRQRLFVIRNGSITPDRKQITRGLGSISARAIGTLLKVSGINDLYRLYLSTRDDNVEFRYVSIPPDYVRTTEKQFDEAEMNRQYELGYKLGFEGIPWQTVPPGYALPDQKQLIAGN